MSRTCSRRRMRTRFRMRSGRSPATSSRGTALGRFWDCAFCARSLRDDLFRPHLDRLFERLELLGEEVIGAGDDDALGVADAFDELLQLRDVAVLVLRAVDEEHRTLAVVKVAEVVFVDGGADEEHRVDVGPLAGDAARDPRAE